MLHTSRARTRLFTELEVNRVQAEPSVSSLTRLGLTIWSQLQTFENTVKKCLMKGGRQKKVRRENKKKSLKALSGNHQVDSCEDSHRASDMFPE